MTPKIAQLRNPLVGVRIPINLIAELDTWAKRSKITRSEAVRQLIEEGLAKTARRAPSHAIDSPAH